MSTINELNSTLSTITSSTSQVGFQQSQKNLSNGNNGTITQAGFLQLLMAQLKYQDPTNPMDSNTMVTQEAQLTQIDSLNKLNDTLSQSGQLSQASSLVGKSVQVKDASGNISSGIVNSALIQNGGVQVSINGKTYPVSNISQVFASAP
jgi:flagellar basal-body rod modification protein FlgD